MSEIEERGGLRPVEINGHQEYWRGYFHAWCGLSEHPKAIIEDELGNVRIRDACMVKFIVGERDILAQEQGQ